METLHNRHPQQQQQIDNSKQKEAAAAAKPKNLLEAFEFIVELAEHSNLDADFFANAATHIKYCTRKLKLTPMQVALLAIFVDRSEDSAILISEIASYAGCRTTKILRLSADIDVLESLRYVRASRTQRCLRYRVPMEVLEALRQNKPYQYAQEPVPNTAAFFESFNKLMNEKDENEISHEQLLARTDEMLEEIACTTFAQGIRKYDFDDNDRLLFVYMAHLFVENNDDNIGFRDLENIYDNNDLPRWVKSQLRRRESDLFIDGLIENVNEEGMARPDAFKLTLKAKEELLCELDGLDFGKSPKGLIQSSTLAAKTLYYNPDEQNQVNQLATLLAPERFADIQANLRKAGMRSGFCCIFYGAPGTGKTETVYQLARLTGRDILRVDVDKIKSCWVGESEKNIKALFDRYRAICHNTKLAPILLFNEADAVLGVRKEGASSAVDKMENSIQNIILQEMEALEGIMIATTNLTTNLDRAFERRFLYKIRFEKPSLEARAKIWQTMLDGLTDRQALSLASQFDLTGGEIENIARKHSVNAILSGRNDIDLDQIADTCRHERLSTYSTPRVGF